MCLLLCVLTYNIFLGTFKKNSVIFLDDILLKYLQTLIGRQFSHCQKSSIIFTLIYIYVIFNIIDNIITNNIIIINDNVNVNVYIYISMDLNIYILKYIPSFA